MKTWLVVYILLNGVWTPGDEVKPMGWHPRAYATRAECEKRKAFAIKAVRGVSKSPSKWFCTADPSTPLAELEKAAEPGHE